MRHGERWYDAPDHPDRNQLHGHEVHALANSTGCKSRAGNASERRSYYGAMADMTRTHRYGIPWHHLPKWGHGEVDKLTVSPTARVAVSERASKTGSTMAEN